MSGGSARVVGGRYRLSGWLGRGGMGAVWAAHDTLLGRDVALKEIFLPDDTVGPDDPSIRRAFREARAAARLRHRGIVTVHDVVTDDGRPWIVMELIDGPSLAAAIRERGTLDEQQTAAIGLQVLDALRAAHRQGVLHRDVKPANILLDTDRVVLTDFGIAAIDDATSITSTGQMVGSPAFLAPERFGGQPATTATDLWALGVTLYIAVTGRSPFPGDDIPGTLAAILHSSPEPPAEIGALWPVIAGLLAKDPADRLTADRAHPLLSAIVRDHGPRPVTAKPVATGDPDRPAKLPPTLVTPPPTIAAPTAGSANETAPSDTAPAGTTGMAGPADKTVPAGSAGPASQTMPAGPAELAGPADDTVPAGSARSAGKTVPAGPAGETMPAGPAGLAGPADETVPAGSASKTVPTGPADATMPAGPAGLAGPADETVPAGSASKTVPTGPADATMPAAGEIWGVGGSGAATEVDPARGRFAAGPHHPVVAGHPEPWAYPAAVSAARRPFPWQTFWVVLLVASTLIAAGAIIRTAWREWDRSSAPVAGTGSPTPPSSPSPSGVSPSGSSRAIPAAFLGEWSGTANQPIGMVPSWTVTITFTATSPTGGFDTSLSCDGTLTVVAPWPTDREIHLRQETGWNPRGTCVDAAKVTLRIDDGGRMEMSWQDLGEPLNVATASLTRS